MPEHVSLEEKHLSNKDTPLVVWPGKPLRRIFRDSVPDGKLIREPLEISSVRNEYEGCMFGVRADVDLHELRLDATDLVSENDKILKSNIRLNFVGSIPISKNTPNTPVEELERVAPFEVPDPLLDSESVNVKRGETQPCYFAVYVPENVKHGDYNGKILVSSKEGKAILEVVLHVYPVTLPDHRSLYVTNWFSVENIAKAYRVRPWSEDFWKVFEKWVAFMAEHRQNVFWVPLDTIKVYYDGKTYKFDFTIFDKYVEILNKYNADRIEVTHVAYFKQWGGKEITIREFKVVSEDKERNEDGSKIIQHLLFVLEKHLEEKGWLNKTIIHIADEPTEDGLENWINISKLVHEYAPRISRIDAIETVGFNDFLEVWVPTLQHFNDWMESYNEAMKKGHEVWFYTCLNPTGRYPNRFLDYPLLKTRILHWVNYAYELKGYLHWGFNWWGENPFGEPNPNLPPGDSHIAYPGDNGPISSLRLEAMRDGLEDYECLKLLEEKICKIKKILGGKALRVPFERRALEICKKAVHSITEYTRDPDTFIKIREEVIREIIEAESRPLALVLTEPPEWKTIVRGPVMVIVRGSCESDSYVEINGKPVKLRDGYFSTYTYPMQSGEVVVRIIKDKAEKIIKRKFKIV